MPTNRIRVEVEAGGAIKCEVWDKNGTKHDASDVFEQISGSSSAGKIRNEITLRHSQDSVHVALRFIARGKELIFDTNASVIDQILQIKRP